MSAIGALAGVGVALLIAGFALGLLWILGAAPLVSGEVDRKDQQVRAAIAAVLLVAGFALLGATGTLW